MPESPHDVAAATRWFAQWNCYREIVDHDRVIPAMSLHRLLRFAAPGSTR